MLRKIGLVLVVLSLSVVMASPAFAQNSLAESIIDRTFSDVFGSPSQSQYGQDPDEPPEGNVPPQAEQALCNSVVQNNAVPRFVQARIAEQFGLNCEPAGSFFDSFFDGFSF